MTSQPQLLQMALDKKDVVYTPDWVARDMVEFFKPTGRILEPCSGDGAFLKYLPTADWCEIEKGRDFFACQKKYDWIFGNPPYTVSSKFTRHAFSISENVVFLIPSNKCFNSDKFTKHIFIWGGIVHMRHYGSGRSLDFPVGFGIAAVHFQRDYHGGMFTSFYEVVK